MVVYKATCKHSWKFYIGNTQNKVKDRIFTHLDKTRNLINKGVKSDSFASHFANHFINNDSLCKEIGSVSKPVTEPNDNAKKIKKDRNVKAKSGTKKRKLNNTS